MTEHKDKKYTEYERSLCDTYWKLYHLGHTNPEIRPYLDALAVIIRKRGISASKLNSIGYEMKQRKTN